MLVGDLLGSQLRMLELPNICIGPAYLQLLLSKCPRLQSLTIKGEPGGRDDIHVTHSKLKFLKIRCRKCRSLAIDCANPLSTDGYIMDCRAALRTPCSPFSFNFPRLTTLSLSPLHCSRSILEAIATNTPLIDRLEAHCTRRVPWECFHSLPWPCDTQLGKL